MSTLSAEFIKIYKTKEVDNNFQLGNSTVEDVSVTQLH